MKNFSILTLVVIAVSLATAAADTQAWVNLGPSPPAIEGPVAADPVSRTIYIGTFGGGILKSTDHGQTFLPANTGLPSLDITSIAMNPRNANHLVAGTGGNGIVRTVDGGASWTVSSGSGPLPVFLAVDPINSDVFYAGYGVGNTAAIQKSVNGGADWVKADSGIRAGTTVWSIVPDPNEPGVVYAGTGNAGGFKSTNSGTSWLPMPIQPVVWALAVDPRDSRIVYAGVNGDGVFKSTDAGATFARAGSPEAGVVLALVVDPTDSSHLYAGTISGGVAMSTDGGATWRKTSVRDGIIVSLSILTDGTTYVGTAFDGAFVSRHDRGRRRAETGDEDRPPRSAKSKNEHQFYQIAGNELRAINSQNVYSITVDPLDSRHLILGSNDGGLIGSMDGGVTWKDVGKGLLSRSPRKAVYSQKIPGRIWVGSFEGGGLYSSDDNGAQWNRHAFGSPGIYVWTVEVDPHSGAIYAGTKGEGLWRSIDGGSTFSRIDGGTIPQVRYVAFDPVTPGRIIVASISGIWRSLDGGGTFAKVAAPATLTMMFDSANPNIVFAGTQTLGVYKSIDGGATFGPSNSGITTLRMSRSSAIQMDPRSHATIYAGTEGGGVFKSIDAGATWTAINSGLTQLSVFGIALDETQPDVLYAVGPGGVFRTTTAGQ